MNLIQSVFGGLNYREDVDRHRLYKKLDQHCFSSVGEEFPMPTLEFVRNFGHHTVEVDNLFPPKVYRTTKIDYMEGS